MRNSGEIELARRELQRLGYLSHRVERFLLQDALSEHDPTRAMISLALRVGALAGVLLAFVNALALAAANGVFARAPLDVAAMLLHLVPPLVLFSALGFGLAAGGFLVAVRLFPGRSLEGVILGVTFAFTVLAVTGALWRSRGLLLELPAWQRVVAALAVLLAGGTVAKLLANGLLSIAIRLTRMTPRTRLVPRRVVAGALGGALVVLLAIAVFAPARGSTRPPVALPEAPGERVLLIGVDGVLPEEVDYLLARGDLPAASALLAEGGALVSYRRDSGLEPAEFWTDVATGVDGRRHGVRSLDSFRPLGVSTPLARNGPWRTYWNWIERPLGLAEYRPLLSSRRSAFAIWELAARGGSPSVAADWWSTFPAEDGSGLVVSHGAYQLLLAGSAGAVAPEGRTGDLTELARQMEGGAFAETLAAAVPAPLAADALGRAILPDRFYREVVRRESAERPRATALYLPALDLVAEGWLGGDVALADLVRRQLQEVDQLLGELVDDQGVAVILFDPGRRRPGDGRALLWRRGCRAEIVGTLDPLDVAPTLLRALGLPQSRELQAPVPLCGWAVPPAVVDGYGERAPRVESPESSREYLDNLRSLGYL